MDELADAAAEKLGAKLIVVVADVTLSDCCGVLVARTTADECWVVLRDDMLEQKMRTDIAFLV